MSGFLLCGRCRWNNADLSSAAERSLISFFFITWWSKVGPSPLNVRVWCQFESKSEGFFFLFFFIQQPHKCSGRSTLSSPNTPEWMRKHNGRAETCFSRLFLSAPLWATASLQRFTHTSLCLCLKEMWFEPYYRPREIVFVNIISCQSGSR